MKTYITSVITLIFLSLAISSNANGITPPVESTYTISGTSVFYKIDQMDFESIFSAIQIEEDLNQMKFESKEKIEFIQVINVHNFIELQIPVESNKLVLDLQDFEEGAYALNFLVKGKEQMVRSQFTKK